MSKQFSYISLFLLCATFFDMPYGFYQFLRIFILITSLYNLFADAGKKEFQIGWVTCVITYNPIIPLYLSRENWNIINIITILFISLWLYKTKNLDTPK